jgi:NADPH2:quinone reductase
MFLVSRISRFARRSANPSTTATRLSSLGNPIAPRFTVVRTMASIPRMMKGVYIQKTGGTDVLEYREDIPVPDIKDNEVLVKNEFIGINYIDT